MIGQKFMNSVILRTVADNKYYFKSKMIFCCKWQLFWEKGAFSNICPSYRLHNMMLESHSKVECLAEYTQDKTLSCDVSKKWSSFIKV